MFKHRSGPWCASFAVVSQLKNILYFLINSVLILVVFGNFCNEWHICAYNNVKYGCYFRWKRHNVANNTKYCKAYISKSTIKYFFRFYFAVNQEAKKII